MNNDHNQLNDFFGLKQKEPEKKKESFKKRLYLIPKVLSLRERYGILVLLLVIIGSVIALPFTTFYHFTNAAPAAGGSFSEGIVGEPRHINPLLSQTNDADRDLVSLVYSGLLKYNAQGKLVPDLAKSYEISSDGLTYTVYLKENTKWHDGQIFNADDVVFTIRAAQNQDYGSLQRINWQGVEVEKNGGSIVVFKLKNKYAQFLNNLTLPILPAHIWENIKPINFSLSEYNLKPIGAGPYVFSKYKKDAQGRIRAYEFTANKQYYDGRPYIDNIEIKFYDSEDELIDDYNRNNVENLGYISPKNLKKIKFKQRLNFEELKLPRYFAVFFNDSRSTLLNDKNIRLALNYATDRQAIIAGVLEGKGNEVNSPLVDGVIDINQDVKKYSFDLDQAKKVLAADGWGNPDEKGILKKKDKRLSFKITTTVWPELAQVANLLKDQWTKAGIEVTVEALPTPQLQQNIKDRDYEMLLFGEILNIDPDPFSLWHSSQKRDPGLNLSLYENKTADKLLEEARQSLNPLERMKKYDDFQKIVIEDVPAVFIYNPLYIYGQSKDVKGFDGGVISMPSDRFANVEKWYIDTSRVWK